MMQYKAWLFDLDGTLLDTAPDIIAALNRTLVHYNLPPTPFAAALSHVTAGMRVMLRHAIPGDRHGEFDIDGQMRSYFAQSYTEHINELTVPFPGIAELLSRLHDQGVLVAVVTSKYEAMAKKLLATFSFAPAISLILGCDSTKESKPSPEPLLTALEKLGGIAPEEALYVGDHRNDIMAARAARCQSAVAMWGYGALECGDPAGWEADFLFKSPAELMAALAA